MELIDANKKYIIQYQEAYNELIRLYNTGVISKRRVMFENPRNVSIIETMMNNRDVNKLKTGYVPSYDYFFVDDDKLIGVIHIRVRLTDSLFRYGGHIGYAINPFYWRQGYGTKLLSLGLEKARELGMTDKVLVTCDDDNIGSAKVIENNGGILENKVENSDRGETFVTRRYWIKL